MTRTQQAATKATKKTELQGEWRQPFQLTAGFGKAALGFGHQQVVLKALLPLLP